MCKTMLPAYDKIDYLVGYMEDRYPLLALNSKNKIDFENRCYERNLCDQIIESMVDFYTTDPEEILFACRLSMEYSYSCYKHNKRRLDFVNRMINVIEDLDEKLKIFS